MKEKQKNNQVQSQTVKFRAADKLRFASDYNDQFPKYTELCKGEAVELNANDPSVIDWLNNKVIIKE